MSNISDFGAEVVATGLLLVGLALVKRIRKWTVNMIVRAWKTSWRRKKQEYYLESKDVQSDRLIYDYLTELRLALKSDRTRVWQFHNGSVFSSQNPIWKMSCTHESCRMGISHELLNSQNLLSSVMYTLVGVVFNLFEPDGVWLTKYMEGTVYWINVKEMPEGFCKSMLITQGVCNLAVSPIFHRGNTVGCLMVCYCDDQKAPPKEILKVGHCATNISYALRTHG